MDKFINLFTPNYKSLRNWTVFGIFSLIAFFVRFPFFFRDYIDRDESTFILVGQSWVDGYLPYTELWDVKPPLTFLFFAGIIYLFGKSFLAIRLIGALLVSLTAFFTYKVGENMDSKKVGFWSGIGCVLLLSMFGSLQGVMSEHISMAFFMPAIYLILKYKKPYWILASGFLMGISLMVKLNMAYAILFCGLFIAYSYIKRKGFWKGAINTAAYGIGIILIVLLTILPYYLQGITQLWWDSVIKAPLEYAGARRYSLFKLAPTFLVLGAFFFIAWKKKQLNFKQSGTLLIFMAILGVLFSFFKGGRINSHYLIQLHPLFIVLFAIVIRQIVIFKRFNYKPFVFFLLLLLPMEAYIEYVAVIKNKIEKGRFANGEGIDVPIYIQENNLETKNILFTEYHIGYWVLDTKPPTKAATHPGNILKDEMFPFYNNSRTTAMEELRYILEDIQPKTIVTRKNRLIFDKNAVEANEFIDAYLRDHYRNIRTLDKAEIYQRLE